MGASAHPHEMLIMDGLLADLADGLLGAIWLCFQQWRLRKGVFISFLHHRRYFLGEFLLFLCVQGVFEASGGLC